MEDMIPCSVKDQEVFQRVWQRVMAGRGDTQGTIPPNMEGDLSCERLKALARQEAPTVPDGCGQPPEEEAPTPDCPMPEAPTPDCPMPEAPTPDCPMPEAPAPDCPMPEEPAPEPPAEETPVPDCPPEEEPAPTCPCMAEQLPEADGSHQGSDLPQLWEEPQEATDRTGRLRRQVMEALEGWQFYRHLARKARAADARVLNGMAGEMHRHARKLSAAYFLITGLRYWPSELLSTPAIPSYWGSLRTRHQTEQRQEMAYRMAADDWEDPNMQEMYTGLIEGCQHRARQLRTLLEQGIS